MQRNYHRPRYYPPESFQLIPGGPDPADVADAAQKVAHALVTRGDDTNKIELDQLLTLVDHIGMDVLAELWADAPAISVGGALWRLYALQKATMVDGDQWAAWYRAGHQAHVARAITGVVEPPSASDLQDLVTQILTGVYTASFADALDRAAAYTRVVSLGMAHHAEQLDELNQQASSALTQRAHRLLRTGEQLETCASQWRNNTLD